MSLGALIIKTRLGLTDEELVEQIKKNPYLQFFIGLEVFQYSAPFDPSMMVYFDKDLPEAVVNDCNERIVHHGLQVIRSSIDHDPGDDDGRARESTSTADQPQPLSQKQTNHGSLLIDATCAPVDIRHPTDLSLLNIDEVFSEGVAREVTEILIDAYRLACRPGASARGSTASQKPWATPCACWHWLSPWCHPGSRAPGSPCRPSGTAAGSEQTDL
jgi:hypothetical protein